MTQLFQEGLRFARSGTEAFVPEPLGATDELMPARQAAIRATIETLEREIEMLHRESEAIASMQRLVNGRERTLAGAVRDVFVAAGFSADLAEDNADYDVAVHLGDSKHLLIVVAATETRVTNTLAEIGRMFDVTQTAHDDDRVVLVANAHCRRPLGDREWLDPFSPETVMVMTGLGATLVTSVTLLRIWRLSQKKPQAAAEHLLQLYATPPGHFVFEADSVSTHPSTTAATSR